MPDEELPDLYRLADLFVMPSTEEGFGIVYLEAAACGLRVVGGAGGGSGDAVPDERVGVLVDPADRTALVEAVTRLLGPGPGRSGGDRALSSAAFRRGCAAYSSLAFWPSRVV